MIYFYCYLYGGTTHVLAQHGDAVCVSQCQQVYSTLGEEDNSTC